MRRPIPEPLAELVANRLRVLGQPIRLRLVDHIDQNPKTTVQELADLLGATQQNISQHLGILFRAGVLTRRKDGTHVHYSLQDQHIVALLEAAAASIGQQLSELSKLVEPEGL